jgi:aminoglycoside phosphotransferase (APT) family kinase protein
MTLNDTVHDAEMKDPLRRQPPPQTLRWVVESLGPGSRIISLRRLPKGGWHANHAITAVDRRGTQHRLVLRRWARPDWAVDNPGFTAAREAVVLDLLAASRVPAPRLVAADAEGTVCDVPTLLLTRLPGRPPALPEDMGGFLGQLAEALPVIHAVDGQARAGIPGYLTHYDLRSMTTPWWSQRPALWERALDLASADPPPGRRCFIHRDYHPENTLWTRGRLVGVVDWTGASWGPAALDTAHMRWNLALLHGLDAADEFLRLHRGLVSEVADDQPYWDVITVLDLAYALDPTKWSTHFELDRLERYLEAVLAQVR